MVELTWLFLISLIILLHSYPRFLPSICFIFFLDGLYDWKSFISFATEMEKWTDEITLSSIYV